MTAECTINVATDADDGELLTLQRAAFVDEARLYGTPEVPALDETFAELADRLRRSTTLVARDRHRIVGAVSLRTDRRPPAVERLMVAPDRRGDGLATRLMAELEELAAREGHREIRLVVGEIAVDNRRLYERLGYRYLERYVVFEHVGLWVMTKDPSVWGDPGRTSASAEPSASYVRSTGRHHPTRPASDQEHT